MGGAGRCRRVRTGPSRGIRRLRRHPFRPGHLLRAKRAGRCAPRSCTAPCGRTCHRTCSAGRTSMRRGFRRWLRDDLRPQQRCGTLATLRVVTPALLRASRRPGRRLAAAAARPTSSPTPTWPISLSCRRSTPQGRPRWASSCDLPAPGVHVEPLTLMGGQPRVLCALRRCGRRRSARGARRARRLGLADHDLRRVANAAVALLSLDLVGVGEAVLQRTVDYTVAAPPVRPADRVLSGRAASGGRTCISRWPRPGWPRTRRSSGSGRAAPATRETAIARMHAATAAKWVTLDAHQLHGGMGYVRRDRSALVVRAGPGAVHAGRRRRRRRDLAGGRRGVARRSRERLRREDGR